MEYGRLPKLQMADGPRRSRLSDFPPMDPERERIADLQLRGGVHEKACPDCGGEFPLTAEYFFPRKHKSGKPGWCAYCKPCLKARAKKSYAIHGRKHIARKMDRYYEKKLLTSCVESGSIQEYPVV